MAMDIGDGDYLGAYRRFFVEFLDKINPDDQLPIKTSGHDVTEGEIVGEIIHMTLQYLDQELCPPSLQCYIVQLVVEEIKATCRKQPETCGFRQEEKTFAPLKLMQAVTGKVNEICQRYMENSRLALLPPPPSTPMPLATAFAIRNNRRKMEDRHIILHDLNTIFNIKDDSIASYYAVFDGHAGHQAAVFCATHLHQYLAESRHYPTDPERALRDAFLSTDASFMEKSMRQGLSSGTTAVSALILNRKLYVAWVGDSQAALAKRGNVTQLVNPHKPDRNDERERVEEMGGTVMHLGIWRVNGNLAVSRAIGDAQYKPYVTGDPEIRCITLDGNEDFLIIACDGLWDCVTEEEAAKLVYRELYRNPYDYASLSQRLVEYAKNQGSVDNITVIVVFLATPRQIASRSTHGNPLLADVEMNNMEPDNRYVSNVNAQYDVNTSFVKQQTATNNGTSDITMEDDYGNYGNKSSNGKSHENGDQVVDYDVEEEDDDDLGPETDVDAVDDVSEPMMTLDDVSRQLFTDKPDPNEIFQNNECIDDDSPPSPTTKSNQRALIPDTDNVGDSEDSEDEWNYYRIDPNKEKEDEAGAAGFSPVPKAENEITEKLVTSSLEERENTIEHEANNEGSDSATDSSSDSESEREIRAKVLIDTEISTDTKCELNQAATTDSEGEPEKIDEQKEENKIKDEEDNYDNDEENMAFQLNPDAAEFVPVSPTIAMPSRIDLDMPISGSPLKQTPPMDNIKMPSRREFANEIRHRPHDLDEESRANGGSLEDLEETEQTEKPPAEEILATNLDESEISSTKAEFGDESSLFTASELHRTGVSAIDCSYTGSYELDDSTIDPMTKSFAPDDFVNTENSVDLNAVHDLTDADIMIGDDDATRKTSGDTETNNHRNSENDDELEEEDDDSMIDTLAVNQPDNPLDSSSPVPFSQSHIGEVSSNIEEHESMEIQHERDDRASRKLFQVDPEVEVTSTEEPSMIDESRINKQMSDSEELITEAEIHDDKNISTKLLEMDLEDRGSQDCGFEKCNEKGQVDEHVKVASTNHEESTRDVVSSMIEENVKNTDDVQECSGIKTTKIEESGNIVKITESFNDFRIDGDLISSKRSSITEEHIMQNPLDLNVAPSRTSYNEVIFENETYETPAEMIKAAESPDVGLSPLVEERSKNPFNQMEFSNIPYANQQEMNILMTLDEKEDEQSVEKLTSLEHEKPFQQEKQLEHETHLEHENPFGNEKHFEQKSLVENETPVENACFLEHENPLENESFIDHESHLEDDNRADHKNPLEDESSVRHKYLLEDESPVDHKNPLADESPVDHKNLLEDESPVDHRNPLEDESPVEHKEPLEDKIPVDHKNPLEDEIPVDHKNPLEVEIPVDHKNPLEDEIPVVHENLLEEKSPVVHENLLEEKSPVVHENLLEEKSPVVHENLLEEKSPVVHENLLEEKSPVVHVNLLVDEIPVVPKNPLEDEISVDHKEPFAYECLQERVIPVEISCKRDNISETEDSANVSAGLQLSESLQEFTGLEKQLNPESVSNGLSAHENLMDIENNEAKDTCVTPDMMKIVAEEVESKISELIEGTETKTLEEKTVMADKACAIVATAAATVAALGTAVAAAKTTKTGKPAGRLAPKVGAATKNLTNKSTPTSPTKPASATRTTTSAITKKTTAATSLSPRPNKLDTVAKSTGVPVNPSTKSSATAAAKNVASKTIKSTVRSSTGAPKSKPSMTAVSAKATTPSADKKPTSNGETTRATATSRLSSANPRVSSAGRTIAKSSTVGGAAKSANSTTTTVTTTSASSRPKTASTTSTAGSRLSSKGTTSSGTNHGATTTQRPKTAPSSGAANLAVKMRTASSTKSPITEKQIKDTANKQISSSRTTTTSKMSRVTATNSSTVTSMRRSTGTKTTSTSATTNNTVTQAMPPPIKKPASMTRVSASKTTTTNGKTTKISSTATSKANVVMENGVCTAEQGIEIVTSTTTMTTTNNSNDEDLPKKDISPVETPTDNQLIITAD